MGNYNCIGNQTMFNREQIRWIKDRWDEHYTQEEIAIALNCSVRTINRVCKGHERPMRVLHYEGSWEEDK